MKKSAKSLDWDQRRQFWRLANDRKPQSLANLDPRTAAFRFSARLWCPGWGPQTCQQFVHPASHLLRGRLALLVFPWAQFWLNQVAGQHQMVMHNGDNMTPALKLLWGPQTRGFPQQRLFVKAIPMLLPEAENIPQSNLGQIHLRIADPDKPTNAWVTLLVGSMRSHHAQDCDLQPASLFDMHALPPTDFHPTTFVIGAAPRAIWLGMRTGILGLQFGSIFAWTSFLPRWRGCGPVKTAIAFQAAQHPNLQGATAAPQPRRVVASIQHRDGILRQLRDQQLQLFVSHLDCCGARGHPLLIQNIRPATGGLRQDHYRRKLPAKGDRVLAFWQIMHMLCSTICRSHCIRTRNLTPIDPDPEPLSCFWFGQIADKGFSQTLFLDTPIFKRFIQARPFALKPQRLRHFGKRFRLRFCHQGIDGIEQGVLGSQKTVMDIVTKLSQCVNVFQTSKLPLFDDRNFTRRGRPPQGWGAF